ncbi:hypothetical protein IMZ48_26050, partial [Candidatus Bathyarchaeota archaeon]|nr:hypothetical protein [Candidatus Bathyarchaeota archaeon]
PSMSTQPEQIYSRRNNKMHHCPICDSACTVRCEAKGHVLVCELHNKSYQPGWRCVKCGAAERRQVIKESKDKAEKRKEEEERKLNAPAPRERKKVRSPEKIRRREEEAAAEAAAHAVANNQYAAWSE